MENPCKYYCLNIIVNISSLSPLNTNVNTTLKYYSKQGLNKKLKLIVGALKFFTKKLLGQEIFGSLVPWARKNFFEKFVKFSSPPSYIINVRSLTIVGKECRIQASFTKYLRKTLVFI